MNHYTTIHTSTVDGFDIVLSTTPEHEAPDWEFDSDQDRQDTLEKIDRGDLAWFVARVQAFKCGVLLGEEYLGGCCYDKESDFVGESGYYDDMVQNAIDSARAKLAELAGE